MKRINIIKNKFSAIFFSILIIVQYFGICAINTYAVSTLDLKKGDANGDGTVNVRDASFIAVNLAKGYSSVLPDSADYNGDGKINVRDAASLAKYLADIAPPAPAVTTKATTKVTTVKTTAAAKTTTKATTQAAAQPSSGGIVYADVSNAKYILNTNTKKFHRPGCASAKKISAKNKKGSNSDRSVLISAGYQPCGKCHP